MASPWQCTSQEKHQAGTRIQKQKYIPGRRDFACARCQLSSQKTFGREDNSAGGEPCSQIYLFYLFISICVCKNPACQIGFKSFGCKSAENVVGTAAVTDTQNSPHTAITIANTTVPSLSNSRLTFGWRKHTQR